MISGFAAFGALDLSARRMFGFHGFSVFGVPTVTDSNVIVFYGFRMFRFQYLGAVGHSGFRIEGLERQFGGNGAQWAGWKRLDADR